MFPFLNCQRKRRIVVVLTIADGCESTERQNVKTVHLVGHSFDCLPGHVTIAVTGSGSTLQSATCDAVRSLFADEKLNRKRIASFKISLVVVKG